MRRTLLLTLIVMAVTVIGPVMPTAAIDAPEVRIERVSIAPAAAGQTFASDLRYGWVQSAPMATIPFAMIAMDLPGEVSVQIRTAQGEGDWSSWVDLPHQHDEGPDPDSPEALQARTGHRSHPVFTDAADRLQVRASGDLEGLQAHLIDPFGLDRSWLETLRDRAAASWRGTPDGIAHALADQPPIVSRAQWGADESLVRGAPSYARSVDRAFVHHTVGSNDYSQAQAPGVVRGVMAFHVNGNGWSDIGYNFLVDRFGTIYEGRAGGIDRAVIGAQAGGFNTFSTGVALMGTFTGVSPNDASLSALERIIAWKADVHHFHPLQTGPATSMGSSRFPADTVVTLNNVSGHRDVSTTACPGDATYPRLAAIRTGVRQAAGDLIVNHATDIVTTRVIRGTPDAGAITFTGELDPPGAWALEVMAPDGRVVHRDSGSGDRATSVMPLPGSGWALGDYDWALSSPGRRTATEYVTFDPPAITGLDASPALVTADATGRLTTPLAIHADLWADASWSMTVIDPAGAVVHREQGQGSSMDVGWFAGVTEPGTYTIAVAAEDAITVRRTVEARYDLLPRIGDAADPIGGAVLISGATFGGRQADRAVLARHDVFADALAGGPLAGTEGPLLLTTPDQMDGRVIAELDRVLAPGATVYVLGGPAAISDAVIGALAARYGDVVRLAGPSRFATAAAIADVVLAESGATSAMVARAGPDSAAPWADALAGGAYGARAGVPVLLTDTASLSPDTSGAITRLGITRTLVLGGTAAVSDAVMAALPLPTRLSGLDRIATATAVAQSLWGTGVTEVVLANGYSETAWAWALAAAPMAARRGAPLLLTAADGLPAPTGDYLSGTAALTAGTVVGPTSLVGPEVGYDASNRIRR